MAIARKTTRRAPFYTNRRKDRFFDNVDVWFFPDALISGGFLAKFHAIPYFERFGQKLSFEIRTRALGALKAGNAPIVTKRDALFISSSKQLSFITDPPIRRYIPAHSVGE